MRSTESRPRFCLSRLGAGARSTRRAARASAFCSKARRRVLLDVDHGTYPFVTSSNTVAGQAATGSGMRPARCRLCAGHRQGLYHARGRRAVPDRTHRRDRREARPARRGIRHRDGAQAALRLVRFRAGASDRRSPAASTASRSPSSTCSTALTKSRSASAIASTAGKSTICRQTKSSRRGSSRSTKRMEGWQESTRGARSWARASGDGREIYPPHGGADRRAGGTALDQPRTRRHDPRARSLRGSVSVVTIFLTRKTRKLRGGRVRFRGEL